MYGLDTTMPKSRLDQLAEAIFRHPFASVGDEYGTQLNSSHYVEMSALFLAIHRRGFEVALSGKRE